MNRTLTKQHYNAIADAIREAVEAQHLSRPDDKIIVLDTAFEIAYRISLFAVKDNDRFDAAKFLHACGFQNEPWLARLATEQNDDPTT